MTDTAAYADLLLPATTFLEHYDVAKGYGAYHLHLSQPAIDASARRGRITRSFASSASGSASPRAGDELGEAGALMDAAARLPAPHAAALLEGRLGVAPGDGRPVQFVDVMPKTADGRAHLFPADLEMRGGLYAYAPDPATVGYPLSLISPASEHTISSTLGEFRPGIARLKIHPDDAHARSIARRRHGADFQRARPRGLRSDRHARRCAPAPSRCRRASGRAARSTAPPPTRSSPTRLTDLAGGACFNDARVQVELLGQTLTYIGNRQWQSAWQRHRQCNARWVMGIGNGHG